MRDDIETMLHDAGQDPTRPVDVDAVHAAGRRRARTRTTAAGLGALALLGVVAVGVVGLLPDGPEVPFVDQLPAEESSEEDVAPVPGGDASEEAMDGTTDAIGVGSTLASLSLTDSGVAVTLAEPDGSTTSYVTESLPREGSTDGVVVDDDGRVVYVDQAGTLTRADATSTVQLRTAEEGPWAVLGTTAEGDVLLGRGGGPLGDDDSVWVLTDTDVVLPPEVPVVTDPANELTVTAPQEERLDTATSSGGRLVASMGIGDSTRWVESIDGEVRVVYSSATMPFVTWRMMPTFVDGELWAVERRAEEDGAGPDVVPEQDLVLRAGEPDELVVPLPLGRGLDGYAWRITTGTTADGGPAALITVRTADGWTALLVDVARTRALEGRTISRLDDRSDVRFLG